MLAFANWYRVKITHTEEVRGRGKRGKLKLKQVSKTYLVQAQSYTEAEANATKLGGYYHKYFKVSDVVPARFNELKLTDSGEHYFEVRFKFLMDLGKWGKSESVLIEADTFPEAVDIIKEMNKSAVSEWKITSQKESNIEDVFKFEKGIMQVNNRQVKETAPDNDADKNLDKEEEKSSVEDE